ncbi:MAG: NTP transferase domain-containing protein [Bacteroidales bacterium]|nr:NTP transferase domain-containing protein [Bacteroidales bacterium]MBN2755720.1 NTP transferase domain-containing protein [Bacteroidales bacterium]
MSENYSVIILAAGNSSRMGKAKFALKFDNSKTFIEKIIDKYQNFNCQEIIIVLNKSGIETFKNLKIKNLKSVKIIENNKLEFERFYSIKIGLSALKNNAPCFIQNSDNPFINNDLLRILISNIKNYDYINPYYKNKGGHPILLSEKLIKKLISENQNNINFRDFLKNFSHKKIETDDKNILININSEIEYYKYFGNVLNIT